MDKYGFIEETISNSDSEDEQPAAGARRVDRPRTPPRPRRLRRPPLPTVNDIERVHIMPNRALTQREHDEIGESIEKDRSYQEWLEVNKPEEVQEYTRWKSDIIHMAGKREEARRGLPMPERETIYRWVNREFTDEGALWQIDANDTIEERLEWERRNGIQGPQSLSRKIEQYRINLVARLMPEGIVTLEELREYEDGIRNGVNYSILESERIRERIEHQMELESNYPEFRVQYLTKYYSEFGLQSLTEYINRLRQEIQEERKYYTQQYNSRGGALKYKKSRKSKKVKNTRKSRKSKK